MPILIFNADDYGLSPGASRGIRASAAGVVRSTTVMANLVAEADAQALAASGLACGAHLTLSTGQPLTDYPRMLLRQDGSFDKHRALDPVTWEDEELRQAAVAEWAAQLARLYGLGLRIGHLDSHHHTHMVGYLFADAARFARDTNLPLRCRHMMRDYLREVSVAAPDSLVEGYFGAGHLSREALFAALDTAHGEIIEVMCHPGYVDDDLRERSGYLAEREEELATLSDPALTEELEQRGWRLGTYADVM